MATIGSEDFKSHQDIDWLYKRLELLQKVFRSRDLQCASFVYCVDLYGVTVLIRKLCTLSYQAVSQADLSQAKMSFALKTIHLLYLPQQIAVKEDVYEFRIDAVTLY
jgi:hypothetical protein